jgi:hypothetical protein
MNIAFYYYYRWWLAVGVNTLLLLFAFMVDIRPLYQAGYDLKNEEKRIIQAIQRLQKEKSRPKQILVPKKKNEVERANEITSLALASGLVLQQITVHSSMLHTQIQGDFARVVDFLRRFNGEVGLLAGDFSYHAGGKVEMDFLMSSVSSQASIIKAPAEFVYISPFCDEADTLSVSLRQKDKAGRFSIRLMRMMGYIEQGDRKLALVQLPDGSLIEVFPKVIIGKEQAVVSEINENQFAVLLPNKNRILFQNK